LTPLKWSSRDVSRCWVDGCFSPCHDGDDSYSNEWKKSVFEEQAGLPARSYERKIKKIYLVM